MSNVENFEEASRRLERLERPERPASIDRSGGDSHPPGMDSERLAKLEGAYDALKVVRPMTIAVMAVFVAVMLGGFAFLGFQNAQLSTKLEGIPQVLREEFRAMRAEMAAQTSAIANSITATKQAQPPAPPVPPQIVVIPPSVTPLPPPTKQ
jgi:hypothetical protein